MDAGALELACGCDGRSAGSSAGHPGVFSAGRSGAAWRRHAGIGGIASRSRSADWRCLDDFAAGAPENGVARRPGTTAPRTGHRHRGDVGTSGRPVSDGHARAAHAIDQRDEEHADNSNDALPAMTPSHLLDQDSVYRPQIRLVG